jgi:UDP:flavonoid glycosyltransferase YjiC (YdhE family)
MKDWNDSVHVTGFLNLPEPPSDQQMPEDLKRFIQSGEPPVYMTFGSCTQFDLENSTRLMIDAAKLSGQRTIIQTDLSAHSFGTDPNIHFIGRAPHSVVFPLCSAIVHHGGAGTTQAALLAGKPSVVVAHGFDQPYWGRLLEKAGASGKCLTRNGLSADQLAAQIEAVTSAASISIHADRLGKAMKQEHGVARAIEAIAAMNI